MRYLDVQISKLIITTFGLVYLSSGLCNAATVNDERLNEDIRKLFIDDNAPAKYLEVCSQDSFGIIHTHNEYSNVSYSNCHLKMTERVKGIVVIQGTL